MAQLGEKRKLQRLQNRHILTIRQTFPNENVKNMLTAWQAKIGMCDDIIGMYDEKLALAKSEVSGKVEELFAQIKKNMDEYKALSPEERATKLLAEADATMAEQQKLLDNKEEYLAEQFKNIENEFVQLRAKAEMDKEEMTEAIRFWTNPENK